MSESIIKKEDNNINILNNSMIQNIIMSCNRCIIKEKCPIFKKHLDKIKDKVLKDMEYDKKLTDIKNSGQNAEAMSCDIDGLNDAINIQITKEVKKVKHVCDIEKKFIQEEYGRLNTIYEFKSYPQLEYLAMDIIRNQLKKFRLDLIQSKFGIMQKVYDKVGNELIKLTPGMHYDIEYSKSSADTIKKMDEIKNGIKTTNINIDVDWDEALRRLDEDE